MRQSSHVRVLHLPQEGRAPSSTRREAGEGAAVQQSVPPLVRCQAPAAPRQKCYPAPLARPCPAAPPQFAQSAEQARKHKEKSACACPSQPAMLLMSFARPSRTSQKGGERMPGRETEESARWQSQDNARRQQAPSVARL